MFGFFNKACMYGAVDAGDIQTAKRMIAKGVNLDQPLKSTGTCAMHVASGKDQNEMARFLVENGADPNVRGPYGYTPLHVAASTNHPTIADTLLALGANVDAEDENGMTPLHVAAQTNNAKVAEVLIAHGADLNHKMNQTDWMPLDWAEMKGSSAVAEILRTHGAMQTE